MGNTTPFVVVPDDDESVCRAIERLLRSVGFTTESYSSGKEFLNTLSSMPSHRPDCVIIDIQMPGLNGLEVQRPLRGSGLPAVFITAYNDMNVRAQALSRGDTFMTRSSERLRLRCSHPSQVKLPPSLAPLAIVVFIASIEVPMLKIIALVYLTLSAQFH